MLATLDRSIASACQAYLSRRAHRRAAYYERTLDHLADRALDYAPGSAGWRILTGLFVATIHEAERQGIRLTR
jgi:hypothetical protein